MNYASAASGAGEKRHRHAAALKPSAMEIVGFTVWIPRYVPDEREPAERERQGDMERSRKNWGDELLPFAHAGESPFREEGEPREEAGGSFLEVQPRPQRAAREAPQRAGN